MAHVRVPPGAVRQHDGGPHGARPPWLAPVVAGAAGAAGLAYLRAVDPNSRGAFPVCPFHRLTGLWCPGCGMTRALHELLNGDVRGALGTNVFVPLVVVLGAFLWLAWLWPAVFSRRLRGLERAPARLWGALAVVTLLYGVLRNLPFAPCAALAP